MPHLQIVFPKTGMSKLPVLFQGQAPTCVKHTRANMVNAWMRIFKNVDPNWSVDQVEWESDPDDPACGYIATTPGGSFKIRNGTCERNWKAPTTSAELIAMVKKNGVLQIGVPASTRTFSQAWSRRKNGRWLMPVVDFAENNGPTTNNHSIFVIGWTSKGLIILNSWGKGWGKKGMALLTWDFIFKYNCHVIPYSFDGHTVDTAQIKWSV